MSEAITPFHLDVPEAALTDLRQRLANTRWPERETVEDWGQGVPLARAQALAEHWRDRYDWRACEARLTRWGNIARRSTAPGSTFSTFAHPSPMRCR